MEETGSENNSDAWKKFLRKHWNMVAVFIVGAVLAAIGAILVFLWFVADAQSTGMVPTTLSLWTMGHMVTFTLHLILWEVLFVGIPVIIGAVAGWLWWKKLPDEEKKEYHFFGKRSRTTSGGGGISLLFTIAFCIDNPDFVTRITTPHFICLFHTPKLIIDTLGIDLNDNRTIIYLLYNKKRSKIE